MVLRADDLIDRRRLRRKLTFWRVLTLLVLAAAVIATARFVFPSELAAGAVDHIARVKIEGTITEDD
ncbi:MAG TPA: signal peptide peptidase SppA, partial [Tianweitania sediminis]|nr:signal peptide peptidase SppA [Tianweitania sediminis]